MICALLVIQFWGTMWHPVTSPQFWITVYDVADCSRLMAHVIAAEYDM